MSKIIEDIVHLLDRNACKCFECEWDNPYNPHDLPSAIITNVSGAIAGEVEVFMDDGFKNFVAHYKLSPECRDVVLKNLKAGIGKTLQEATEIPVD